MESLEIRVADVQRVRQRLAYSFFYALFIGCAIWAVYTMQDPNYRWSFVDDNVMRVRNIFLTLAMICGVLITRRMQRINSGQLPAAYLFRDASSVTVRITSNTPLTKTRIRRISAPITVRFREDKSVQFVGKQHLRTIQIKGAGSSSSIVSFGPWEEGTEERVREFLADLMERPEATANE